MDIIFGWGLDGADWSDAGAAASLGSVTTGQRGFADILAVRLGLSRAPEPPALRVAAYRDAIGRVDPPWCRDSFALNPWAVAERLLAWRDELVTAGWSAQPAPGLSPRLLDLAYVEEEFDRPGDADVLRDIARELGRPGGAGAAASTGIRSVAVVDRASLPRPWPAILDGLAARGVEVTDAAPGRLRALRVVAADTEWEAAEAAARLLCAEPSRAVVAGGPTQVLDQELARRGLPRAGAGGASPQRSAAELPAVALRALSAPFDPWALLRLADARVPVVRGTGAAAEAGSAPLLPPGVRRAVISALKREPGHGGAAWDDAMAQLEGDDAAVAADLSRQLSAPVEPVGGGAGAWAADDVAGVVEWLEGTVARAASAAGAAPSTATISACAAVRAVLPEEGDVSAATLRETLATCTGSPAAPLPGSEAPDAQGAVPAVAGPGAAPASPILWWAAASDDAAERSTWTPAERRALAAAGCEPPTPRELTAAGHGAAMAGLRRAGDVVAVVPRRLRGADAEPDPALMFAAVELLPEGTDRTTLDTVDKILEPFTVDARDLDLPAGAPALRTPEPASPDAGALDAAARGRDVPDGAAHLPARLSFSQIESLLSHQLEWFLERRLGIREPWWTQLPEGNRMIGTFLHAIVEEIVGAQSFPIEPDEVETLARRLAPVHAPALLLPGRERALAEVIAEARASIPALFRDLADAGITPVAAEREFSFPVDLELTDPADPSRTLRHRVELGGFRDLDADGPAGSRTVVDLKYTAGSRKYPAAIAGGRALQLAVYARSVEEESGGALPMSAVTTAYFLLKQNRFVSEHPGLDGSARTGGLAAEDLWAAAKASLEEALSRLAFGGRVEDAGNAFLLDHADLSASKRKSTLDGAAEAALAESRYLPADAIPYVTFPVITGLEADPR
ncbi:PD-(D/E)XK nuclease family protein [Corynebacterium sp. 335C]